MVNSSIKLPPSSEYGAFLTVSDMAELLKVSRFVIDRMLKTGRLPAAKLGGNIASAQKIFSNGGRTKSNRSKKIF